MANAQRFNELYAGVRDVFVPKVYSELTTSKVLTMEWVDGFRLTDQASLQRYGLDESKLVDTLVQCSLRQILGKYMLSILCSCYVLVLSSFMFVSSVLTAPDVSFLSYQRMDSSMQVSIWYISLYFVNAFRVVDCRNESFS